MSKLTDSPAWQALRGHAEQTRDVHMRDQFADQPDRFARYSLHLDDLLLDYSRNRISDDTLRLLLELADERGVAGWIARMFGGEHINSTEDRAVLHVALRNRSGRPVLCDGVDVMPDVQAELEHMRVFSEQVRSGRWTGWTGRAVTDVVNIGIGGSDLGPLMVTEALKPYGIDGPRPRFVSNVDGADITETLRGLDPETTLFIVASKTFTTQETLVNANSARDWLLASAGDDSAVARHFVAVSTNIEGVLAFGIGADNMFGFWDWVGGRYSLWSAIGLSIVLSVGMPRFIEMLEGAHAMDEHFRSAPLAANMPVIMALLGIWYSNFLGAQTHAILPYDQYLHRFTAYFQQADMESNGKSIDRNSQPVDYDTGPVIWGEPGTNGQHAFYQLLHQGTRLVPVDLLAAANPQRELGQHHAILLSNFLAQGQALMLGRTGVEVERVLRDSGLDADTARRLLPHRVFAGNRPSNSLLYRKLDPRTLGMLIALYEHKVFVQGVIWNINSFDQWGVELGKKLAVRILDQLHGEDGDADLDASTRGLLEHYRSLVDSH